MEIIAILVTSFLFWFLLPVPVRHRHGLRLSHPRGQPLRLEGPWPQSKGVCNENHLWVYHDWPNLTRSILTRFIIFYTTPYSPSTRKVKVVEVKKRSSRQGAP